MRQQVSSERINLRCETPESDFEESLKAVLENSFPSHTDEAVDSFQDMLDRFTLIKSEQAWCL